MRLVRCVFFFYSARVGSIVGGAVAIRGALAVVIVPVQEFTARSPTPSPASPALSLGCHGLSER